MIARLIVLHTLLAGMLVAGWFFGVVPMLWHMDRFYAIPVTAALAMVGVGLVARNAIDEAGWLVERIPAVGMLLTVSGLLWASNGDLASDAFKRDVIHALVGNLGGVLAWLWLDLVIKFSKRS